MKRILAAATVLLMAAVAVFACSEGPPWFNPQAVVDHSVVPQGGAIRVAVVIDIDPAYHVYANPPGSPDFIPVTVEPQGVAGIRWGAVRYPPGQTFTPKTSIGESVKVYAGRAIVLVDATVADDATPGQTVLPLNIKYQGCTEDACYPPAECLVSADVRIAAQGEAAVPAAADIFAAADAPFATQPSQTAAPEGSVDLAAAYKKNFLLYLGVLLVGGLALCLTPCVFPLIPVTMTFFAQQVESRPSRVFPLAALYALGLATAFTVVGVLAALAGKSMGVVLTQPVGVLAITVVLVVMMASAFGAFEIRLPSGLMGRLGGRRGHLGALFMGLVMGAVAAPCVGPFLFALIAFIAAAQSVVLGAVSFFTVGIGLGLPFIALGLFASQINRFPRSGGWLVWVKQLMGLALGGLILYFIQRFIDPDFFRPLAIGYCIFAAMYVGFLEGLSRRPFSPIFWGIRIIAFVAIMAGTVGGYLYVTQKRPEVQWSPWQAGALEKAKTEGRPAIVYFGANWCIACKEWHAGVFSDPEVIKASEPFARVNADVSKPEGALKEFAEKTGGINPPLVLVIGRDGQVVKSYRAPPEAKEFVKTLREALPPPK
jgi:thioredoxin:protein disulfide reductase